uniref:mRNA n=1 Tax=Oulactis sp. TaxID=2093647 RepID=A0A4U8YT02_OULSP|nr:mRNA [Oulactis sp. MM-2018]
MNSKLIVVFLLCAILVACVTSRRPPTGDEAYEDDRERPYQLRNFKRGCTDSQSSTYCGKVVSRNICGTTEYRMNCRKSCGNC